MTLKHLLVLLFLLLYSCGSMVNSGSSTETIGLIVDGKGTPISGAVVTIVREDYNPQSGGVEFDPILSDENGKYSLKGVDDGIYNVHFKKDGTRALRSGLVIVDNDSIRYITDTLRPGGGLKGVVQHQNGDNHKGIFLLFMGTERYASTIDSAGNFLVDNLAEGDYSLKLLSELENYESQTITVSVLSGIVSVIKDTLILAYTGIPTPQGLKATFDTQMQQTQLTWEAIQSDKLKEYYVFRSLWNSSSDFQLIGTACSTSFIDPIPFSGGSHNGHYEYRVQAVSECGLSGKYSKSITVDINSIFETTPLFFEDLTIQGEYKSLAVKDDVLYVAGSSNSIVDGYNLQTGKQISSDTLPDKGARPFDIDVMSNGTLLVNTYNGFYLFSDEHVTENLNPITKDFKTTFSSTVSSVGPDLIYYSAKEENNTQHSVAMYENLLLSFNIETGIVSAFCKQEDRGIEDFYIYQNWMYLLLKDREKITLERSPLGRYEPTVLMTEDIDNECDEDHLSLSGLKHCVALLCNSRVTLFESEKKVLSSPVEKSIAEIELIAEGELIALDKYGYCMRYKKGSDENSNEDN